MLPIFKDGTGTGQDTRIAHTYNGLTLNSPTDDKDDTYQIDTILPRTSFAQQFETNEDRDGSIAGAIQKVSRIVLVRGRIVAPSLAKLHDKMRDLAEAFDPAKTAQENPDTKGFIPYDFDVPTTDTTTYTDGLVESRYYARARSQVEPMLSYDKGHAAMFDIELLMIDPRRYLQGTDQRTGGGVADNSKADYLSWPTVTIAMAGAGSALFSIANSTVGKTLALDLSGLVASESVTVDMEKRTITKNDGTDLADIFVSGDYWWVNPGSNTITLLNDTNATVTTVWRSAFCL